MNCLNQVRCLPPRRHICATKQAESQVGGEKQRLAGATCTMLIVGMILLMVLSPGTKAGQRFGMTDLEGAWSVHILTSGYPDDFQSWAHGTVTCDGKGSSVWRVTNETGWTNQASATLTMNAEGIITAPIVSPGGSAFHGAMRNNKDTIVFTLNDGGGGYNLGICTRNGGTFTTSDLAGTWYWHGLVSGDENTWTGWWYVTTVVDDSGRFKLVEGSYLNSDGETVRTLNGTMNVTPDGVITIAGKPDAHGNMNISKDLFVMTMNDGGGGYSLLVAVKAGGTFTSRDLSGTWYAYGLVSGSSYDDHIVWYHVTTEVDRRGNGQFVPGSYLDCRGDTDNTWTGTMRLAGDGVVTIPGMPTFHGAASLGKDIWVGTADDGGGGYDLMISVGRPGGDEFDSDMDGDVDFIDFADFANHWLN